MIATAATAAVEDVAERITATRFGPVAYHPDAVVDFPLGLAGFPRNRRFVCAPLPGGGVFQLLHGLDGDPLDLVVVARESLGPRHAEADVDAVRAELDIPPADLVVLCVVTLPARGSGVPARVNLRAPIFVDVGRRRAVQVVLANAAYPFRTPLAA